MPDQTMIGRYLAMRDRYKAMGDVDLAKECEFEARRHGWRPDATPAELARAEARAEAEAKPVDRPTTKRKPVDRMTSRGW